MIFFGGGSMKKLWIFLGHYKTGLTILGVSFLYISGFFPMVKVRNGNILGD